MSKKPDKFGLKFWLTVDVKNKYFFDELSYAGKDDTPSSDVSVPTDVVTKLMGQIFQLSCSVTWDKFFTSFNLLQWLAEKKCSLVKKLSQNTKFQKSPKRKTSCTKQKCFGLIVKR